MKQYDKSYESTAKELAFKAWCDGFKGLDCRHHSFETDELTNLKNRFELWWTEHYDRRFDCKHSVSIDLKRYIQAE